MTDIERIRKMDRRSGVEAGVSTIFPFLTADDGASVRTGVAEFSPGRVDVDLAFNEGIFVLDGEIEVDGDGETHVVAVGEFLWLPGGRKISYHAKTPARFLYIIPSAS